MLASFPRRVERWDMDDIYGVNTPVIAGSYLYHAVRASRGEDPTTDNGYFWREGIYLGNILTHLGDYDVFVTVTNTSSTNSIPAFTPVTILNNDGDVSPTPPAYGEDHPRIIHGVTIASIPASGTGIICVSGKFSINMAQNASRTVGERIFAIADLANEGYDTDLFFENDNIGDTDKRVQLVGYLANYTENATDATYLIRSIAGGNVGSASLVHLEEDQPAGDTEGASGNQNGSTGGYRWSATSFSANTIDDFTYDSINNTTAIRQAILDSNPSVVTNQTAAVESTDVQMAFQRQYSVQIEFPFIVRGPLEFNAALFSESWTASPELEVGESVMFFMENRFPDSNNRPDLDLVSENFFQMGEASENKRQVYSFQRNSSTTRIMGGSGIPETIHSMAVYKNETSSSLSSIPISFRSENTGGDTETRLEIRGYIINDSNNMFCFRVSDYIT